MAKETKSNTEGTQSYQAEEPAFLTKGLALIVVLITLAISIN